MYSVETDVEALDEVAWAAHPGRTQALPFHAELITLLELAPWSGDPYNLQRPDANMRTHTIGPHAEGPAIYLVLEGDLRVVVDSLTFGSSDPHPTTAGAVEIAGRCGGFPELAPKP